MATTGCSKRVSWVPTIVTTCLVVGAITCAGITAPARAALVNFSTVINGVQETPPNPSLAFATGTFVMDTVADTLSVNIMILVPPPSGEIAAHIHGFAPPGVPAGILFPLPLGSPKITVWNFSPGQEANIIAGLTYANIHSNVFPGGEIRGQILRVPSCGDGFIDGGEQCDDGNTDNGDCCDSACQYEANGSPCEGASLCTAGLCDGAGNCVSAIRANCRSAGKTLLLVKNKLPDAGDKLKFKWIKGAATTVGEFGSPTTTTEYALCVYAGTSAAPIVEAEVAPSATLWMPSGVTGFKYYDPGHTSDGAHRMNLESGILGKAHVDYKGKGPNLPDPPPGPYALPVTAQLVNSSNNVCFEGVYNINDVITNNTFKFKAK